MDSVRFVNQPFSEYLGNILIQKLYETGQYNCKFTIVSAFSKDSGVLSLKPALCEFKKNGGSVDAFIGVDAHGTSYEALVNLLAIVDNLYIIHDEDLLRVLNELRAAGAEAISLNDQRIVAMSEVRCAGPTVSVNNVRSAPPYVIKAIGAPKTLTSALRLRGGVVETFEFWGIQVKIKAADKVHIPALKAPRNFEYAQSVAKKEEEK